jgi:amino acid transporter
MYDVLLGESLIGIPYCGMSLTDRVKCKIKSAFNQLISRTCFAPNVGGFVEMGTKYVSPHWGFMMGINYILQTGMAIPSELSAIAVMLTYWDNNNNHAGIYLAVFLVVAIATNFVGVR